jgi:hypothetical protein
MIRSLIRTIPNEDIVHTKVVAINETYMFFVLKFFTLCQTQHKGDTLISDIQLKHVTNARLVPRVNRTHR